MRLNSDPDADGGRIPRPAFISVRRAVYSRHGIVALELHHPALTPKDRATLERLRKKTDHWDRGGRQRAKVEAENAANAVFESEA